MKTRIKKGSKTFDLACIFFLYVINVYLHELYKKSNMGIHISVRSHFRGFAVIYLYLYGAPSDGALVVFSTLSQKIKYMASKKNNKQKITKTKIKF